MKRLIALPIAALVLAGCGGGVADRVASGGSAPTESVAPTFSGDFALAADPVEVTVPDGYNISSAVALQTNFDGNEELEGRSWSVTPYGVASFGYLYTDDTSASGGIIGSVSFDGTPLWQTEAADVPFYEDYDSERDLTELHTVVGGDRAFVAVEQHGYLPVDPTSLDESEPGVVVTLLDAETGNVAATVSSPEVATTAVGAYRQPRVYYAGDVIFVGTMMLDLNSLEVSDVGTEEIADEGYTNVGYPIARLDNEVVYGYGSNILIGGQVTRVPSLDVRPVASGTLVGDTNITTGVELPLDTTSGPTPSGVRLSEGGELITAGPSAVNTKTGEVFGTLSNTELYDVQLTMLLDDGTFYGYIFNNNYGVITGSYATGAISRVPNVEAAPVAETPDGAVFFQGPSNGTLMIVPRG